MKATRAFLWSLMVLAAAGLAPSAVSAASGPGTVFLRVRWDFKAPVRPGDRITGAVEVVSVRTDKPITELETSVRREDGTVVLDGTATCYTMPLPRPSA